MKIIGHPLIPSQDFIRISEQEDIDCVLASSIPILSSDLNKNLELAHFCQTHQVNYATFISTIKELIFFANLGAKYLITTPDRAQSFQAIIKEYLFDSLLLCLIENEDEIEELAHHGIDGVIFTSHIKS